MHVLIIAEHNNETLKAATLNTVTAAQEICDEVSLLILGYQCQAVAEEATKIAGLKKVLLIDAECYQYHFAENSAQSIAEVAKDYSHLLAPASTFGKNLMPRVAALLDVGQISDITQVVTPDTFVRPIYAGNAFAKVQSSDAIKVITVRATAFSAATDGTNSAAIDILEQQITTDKVSFVRQELTKSERPELTAARVVISGGRALQSAENFKLLETLADKLNAAIGASRAAVDAGFVPNDYQVGQTGKIVAPELYIAVGISGAIQHLAGMKDSKVIVAINKDPDAPIFQIADYGLVGDLFEIIPELTQALSQ